MSKNRINKIWKAFAYLFLFSLFFSILSINSYAEAAKVCDGNSPCICGSECLDIGGGAGDGTIDTCTDGFFVPTDYVYDIFVTDTDASTFNAGDTINITAQYSKCNSGNDVEFAYHNGSAWRNIYSSTCSSTLPINFSTTMQLDNVGGTHSIRAFIHFDGSTGGTCGDVDFWNSETDDVSFTVAGQSIEIEIASLDRPTDNGVKGSTLVDFNFTPSTINSFQNCSLYIDESGWGIKKTITSVSNGTVNNFTMNLSEGNYIWNVECFDNESNSDMYDSNYSFSVDLTNPTININSPENNSYSNSSTLTVNVSHGDGNPDSIILNVDGVNETIQSYSGSSSIISKTGLSEGTHTYYVLINDSGGNINQSKTRTINIDLTNPSAFDLTSPIDTFQATTSSSLSPLFEWEDTVESNFSNYTLQISVDGSFAAVNHTRYTYNVLSNSSYQLDIALENNYTWYWRVIAYDISGNSRISLSTFTYITNTSDLVVTLNSPVDSYTTNNQTIVFSYTPESENLIDCSLWTNFSGTWELNQSNSSLIIADQSNNFNAVSLNDGLYVWNVLCNISGSSAFSINNYTLIIDTLNPGVNFTDPTPLNNTNQSSVTVIVNITHTDINPSTLILNWNGINESYSYSGSFTNITKAGLDDGTYSYYIWINDTAGNSNQTKTRTITIDNTPPIIKNENITPSIGTNLTIFNITANITDAFLISGLVKISYPNGTISNFSMGNSSDIWYYEFNSQLEGIYNATILVNDTLNNTNQSSQIQFIIDLSPPKYQDITELEDPLSGNTSQIITINVTDALTNIDTVLISYGNFNYTMTLQSADIYTYTWYTSTLGIHNYSFYMNDSVGNLNNTATYNFTINDTTMPNITNILYSPNLTDDLDPNITITVTANITDRYNISASILQYKETNKTAWNNVSMSLSNNLFVGNFTPLNETNYTFRILANDTSGNINTSVETTIDISYDWTWTRSPASFSPLGSSPSQLITIGIITLNNTGDYSQAFGLSNPAEQPSLAYNETMPVTLSPKEVKQIQISAIAPALDGQYDIDITIDATNNNATPGALITSTTLVVSSVSGPNLFGYISQYDPSVEQGQSGINLIFTILNLGDTTAYNVTSNWTIPSDFITTNTINITFSSINVSESAYHSIIVNILPNAALTSSAEISAWANDSTGSFSSDSKLVSVNLPGTSSSPSAGGGGGSGGGGGGGGGLAVIRVPDYKLLIRTKDEVEVIRGTRYEFKVEVINDEFGTLLENIYLEITGFKKGYIRTQPDIKSSIGYREIKTFYIVIDVPRYMRESKYELEIMVSASAKDIYNTELKDKKTSQIKETKKIILLVHELNEEDITCIDELEKNMNDMEKQNFNILSFKKSLNIAKLAKNNKDYRKVLDLCGELKTLKENAYAAFNKISSLQESINVSKKKGYDVTIAEKMLELAIDSFERGNFNKAIVRLREAELSMGFKSIETFSRIKNFFVDKFPLLIAATLIISVTGVLTYKTTEMKRIRGILKDFQKENETIIEMMKKTQKDYFVDKAIGTDLYNSYMKKYRERLSVIQYKTIELRMKESSQLRKGKKDSLNYEAERLTEVIEELQRGYFEKKTIDKNTYTKMFHEFKRRYAEINKKLLERGESMNKIKKSFSKKIADPSDYFYTLDGRALKSIDDLLYELRKMTDESFKRHVNDGKNDFSDWIIKAFGNPELAGEVAKEKTKNDVINILDVFVSRYK